MDIKIIGAGLTGLIAAHIFPQARIYEANTADNMQPHRALLRFRSKAVEEVTGIPFREVTVRKGIWSFDKFQEPNIKASNAYSFKCTGKVSPRSIWDIEPCKRFIAPDNFVELLQENLAGRIEYGKAFSFAGREDWNKNMGRSAAHPVISTVPMSAVAAQLSEPIVFNGIASTDFGYKPIKVYRLDLGEGYDVHQTVYFPFDDTKVYRASITGRTLIVEAVSELDQYDLASVTKAFNLSFIKMKTLTFSSQRFGKIAPIDNDWRRNFIYKLSDELGVYSLGRFGTWRNILLDDVVHDCAVIKRLIHSDSYTKGIWRSGK